MPHENDLGPEGGWTASARAYIALQDQGDPNRTILLDPVMLALCGEGSGRPSLDVGCGEGRFCRMLAQRGWLTIGIDPIAEMTLEAKRRQPGGEFVRGTAERLPFHDCNFHLLVSYITLVDIRDFRAAIHEMARVLAPGGMLVAANLGFVTASDGWQRDEAGNRLYHRVDRYAEERPLLLDWSGIRITNWHRPLEAYMQAFLGAGLVLREFLEPVPSDDSLRSDPYFEDWYRVPLCWVMRWQKV